MTGKWCSYQVIFKKISDPKLRSLHPLWMHVLCTPWGSVLNCQTHSMLPFSSPFFRSSFTLKFKKPNTHRTHICRDQAVLTVLWVQLNLDMAWSRNERKWRREVKGGKEMEKVRRGENDQKKKRKGAAQHKSNTHTHMLSTGGRQVVDVTAILHVRSGSDRMVDRHLHQPIDEDGSIRDWTNRWLPQPLWHTQIHKHTHTVPLCGPIHIV